MVSQSIKWVNTTYYLTLLWRSCSDRGFQLVVAVVTGFSPPHPSPLPKPPAPALTVSSQQSSWALRTGVATRLSPRKAAHLGTPTLPSSAPSTLLLTGQLENVTDTSSLLVILPRTHWLPLDFGLVGLSADHRVLSAMRSPKRAGGKRGEGLWWEMTIQEGPGAPLPPRS